MRNKIKLSEKMRAMPDFRQAHINPNDGMTGGFAHKKKQYHAINQHYISHNAVMPPQEKQNWAPH